MFTIGRVRSRNMRKGLLPKIPSWTESSYERCRTSSWSFSRMHRVRNSRPSIGVSRAVFKPNANVCQNITRQMTHAERHRLQAGDQDARARQGAASWQQTADFGRCTFDVRSSSPHQSVTLGPSLCLPRRLHGLLQVQYKDVIVGLRVLGAAPPAQCIVEWVG